MLFAVKLLGKHWAPKALPDASVISINGREKAGHLGDDDCVKGAFIQSNESCASVAQMNFTFLCVKFVKSSTTRANFGIYLR